MKSLISALFLIQSVSLFAIPLPLYEIRRSIEKDKAVTFMTLKEEQIVPDAVVDFDEEESEPDEFIPSKKESVKKEKKKIAKKKPKVLSPGEKKIQEALERNRRILRERQARQKNFSKKSKKSNSPWGNPNAWMEEKTREMNNWQETRLKEIKRWEAAKKQFQKDLPKIKKDLTPLKDIVTKDHVNFGSQKIGFKKNKLKKSANVKDLGQGVDLVSRAFTLPIRRQGKRPTCAAFAGIRAIELMADEPIRLSEQFLYYKSKSQCRKRPCSKAGSWPYVAFYESMNSRDFDIPLERDCPYSDVNQPRNQTQIPMKGSCYRGAAKVVSFAEIQSNRDIYERLELGQPVIGGFKLTENFFTNNGYVFNEPGMRLGSGIHAQGHALLLIGIMDLPKSLQKTQGDKCILVANSWGEGWGKGGYGCLSKSWFERFRYDMPFLVLEQVAVN